MNPALRIVIPNAIPDPPEKALAESDEWVTPDDLFRRCERAFGPFDIDGAATTKNTKCEYFFSSSSDGPAHHVGKRSVWLNFPYSRGNPARFTKWALEEALLGARFCCLGPCYPAEGWWQSNVLRRGHREQPTVTWEGFHSDMLVMWRRWSDVAIGVHYIPGRVHFVEESGATGPARFSSAVVVYQPVSR